MKIANDRQVKHPRTGRRPVSLPAFEDLVRPHPPRVIQDEAPYENAQEVVDGLTNVANLTAGQTEYLETLSLLMESYETEHHAIETADLSPLVFEISDFNHRDSQRCTEEEGIQD